MATVVAAAPGRVAVAMQNVRRAGGTVTSRHGRLLQVRNVSAAQLRRTPGVAAVGPAQVSWPDAIISQGVYRTGADVLQNDGLTGSGIRIAILDQGFGTAWQSKLGIELPPMAQIAGTQSFDQTTGKGLAGLNENGRPTSHGESVAEVVHDMAPGATLLLVNYHTELEFADAVEWLIHGDDGKPRVDIVAHSNSFLDGPFDGTSLPAQEVDKANAAGILWVNSAGNYQHRHWEGVVADPGGDGWADMGPPGHQGVEFPLAANQAMGAYLYWNKCSRDGVAIPDRSAAYEIDVTDTNSASPFVYAHGVADPTRPLSSTFWVSTAQGTFAVRARQLTPGVVCNLELYGGNMDIGDEATVESSVPTPGDAVGALAVGATNWKDDVLPDYSSEGPTEDGRLKPDLVAPASTTVSPGIAMVGTSASAPHVAGAAALLLQQDRLTGLPATADAVRQQLLTSALDLGPPGPDMAYGYGRLRLDLTPPQVVATRPAEGSSVHGLVSLGMLVDDAATLDTSTVAIDNVAVGSTPGLLKVPWDSRSVPDGPHTATFGVRDMPGNATSLTVNFTVDNTPPVLHLDGGGGGVALRWSVQDAGSALGQLRVLAVDAHRVTVQSLRPVLRFRDGAATATVPWPRLGTPPYRLTVQAFDAAGNPSTLLQTRLRAAPRR